MHSTADRPMGLGRCVERVAKTPRLPSRRAWRSHRRSPPLVEAGVEDEADPEVREARQPGNGLGPRKRREQLQPCAAAVTRPA